MTNQLRVARHVKQGVYLELGCLATTASILDMLCPYNTFLGLFRGKHSRVVNVIFTRERDTKGKVNERRRR
jgi:hypothetical protein